MYFCLWNMSMAFWADAAEAYWIMALPLSLPVEGFLGRSHLVMGPAWLNRASTSLARASKLRPLTKIPRASVLTCPWVMLIGVPDGDIV